jgi:hypothetical protein
METSILTSTKKVLGLDEGYDAFDPDIVMFINAALSTLSQLGIGPEDSLVISGPDDEWDDLFIPDNQLSLVKTYVFLKTRMLFDPPGTPFLTNAMKEQLQEYEWRLQAFVETETT